MPDRTPVELVRGLAVMAEPPDESCGAVAAALGLPDVPTSADYSDVFLFQLYPYASVHLGAEGMLGGDARDRIAGFWRALGLTPPAEPDHLAALLGLYASLAEREGEAEDPAEGALLRQSRAALVHEHLTPWLYAFLERVEELATGAYARWAELLTETLAAEVEALGGEPALSAHLREAPPLPDPRDEGGEAFLVGLLAPVRSGAILTRADLATIAKALGLGLRAGERKYALESLLAQDAERVLRELGAEVARQGHGHRRRVADLGASAVFLADRAEGTSRLLETLAGEAASLVEAAGEESGGSEGSLLETPAS